MPKEYRHIKIYENEIKDLKKQGFSHREIGGKLGFTQRQVKNFVERDNRNKRKLEAGISLKRQGRPLKDYVVKEGDKVATLKYILARKETKIKTLEMENKLMRDFLSLTGRK